MARNPENWLGQELAAGRYKVTAKLGEGGMGFIYKAHDGNLDTDVVIKVPRLSMLVERQFAQRFTRELRSLVNLSHPHIVKIIDVGQQDKIPFAVMQYLSGGDLADRLQDGRVSPDSLSAWLPEIAGALDFVHEEGYVHRDIKPGNILFDKQGHAYLSDFGVAKVVSEEADSKQSQGLTGTGMVIGTQGYMPLEMLLGQSVDGRADQFALAVVVYEALSGSRPFAGDTAAECAISMNTTTPVPLYEVDAGIPLALSRTVQRGLSTQPQERFDRCELFSGQVLAAASGETTSTTNSSSQRRASFSRTQYSPAASSGTPSSPARVMK